MISYFETGNIWYFTISLVATGMPVLLWTYVALFRRCKDAIGASEFEFPENRLLAVFVALFHLHPLWAYFFMPADSSYDKMSRNYNIDFSKIGETFFESK